MQINENLGNNAYRKIAKLLTKAVDLEMDLSGYGEANENKNSGHVYLFMEEYNFTLFISLGSDDIQALWFSSVDGNEIEIPVNALTLAELEAWASNLDIEAEA
jgi:hypothetical protein